MPRKKKPAPLWSDVVGVDPFKVTVEERADRGGRVYLRWRLNGNWARASTRLRIRNADGEIDDAKKTEAYQAAVDQYALLTGERQAVVDARKRPLTLGETWAHLTDRQHGRYPDDSPYRRELKASLAFACLKLGAGFPWVQFDGSRLRMITRARAEAVLKKKGTAFRVAELCGGSLLTIMRTLQGEGFIPDSVAIPSGATWHTELRRYVEARRGTPIPEPERPRYTIDELRKLLATAAQVDPRWNLLLALGAEQRLGQVRRGRRSSLVLHEETGRFETPGRGQKKGAIVELTAGQRAVVDAALTTGYLRELEAAYQASGTDYCLFPQGRLVDETTDPRATVERHGAVAPVHARTVVLWFRATEKLAEIPHVDGRGAYGVRRTSVDGAIAGGISEGGLQASGGWTDPRMPNQVYRDKKRLSEQSEAARVRGAVRGENVPETYPNDGEPTK